RALGRALLRWWEIVLDVGAGLLAFIPLLLLSGFGSLAIARHVAIETRGPEGWVLFLAPACLTMGAWGVFWWRTKRIEIEDNAKIFSDRRRVARRIVRAVGFFWIPVVVGFSLLMGAVVLTCAWGSYRYNISANEVMPVLAILFIVGLLIAGVVRVLLRE